MSNEKIYLIDPLTRTRARVRVRARARFECSGPKRKGQRIGHRAQA